MGEYVRGEHDPGQGMPQQHKKFFFRDVLTKTALLGLLMGMFVSLGSWILDGLARYGQFRLALLPEMHASNPVLWIVNSAPALCIIFAWIHARQRRLLKAQQELLAQLIRQKNEHLHHVRTHDPLTGLGNHEEFLSAITRALQGEKRFAILHLDIDNFMAINDKWGHQTGDAVLQEVSGRLRSLLRNSDVITRYGGDEMLIILNDIKKQSDAVMIAEKMLTAVSLPILLTEKVRVTCSIGISHFPEDGTHADILIRKADQAMFMAKRSGKNTWMLFDQDYQSSLEREKSIGEYMRIAMERKEFFLHYQPKFDRKLRISGMEALARWDSARHGRINPAQFIPMAEKIGLISALGEWTLFHACEQTRRWHDSGLPPVKVAVNLSVYQLRAPGFLQGIRKILDETRLSPRFLEVELTESGAMENVHESGELIRNLHAMGISIAIDDFGTGYSSMQQLVRVPINVLKIDKSFIDDLPESVKSATLARLIINMAKSLDMEVVAEGVENIKQYNALREMDCDLLQGFFLSRPLEPVQFEGLLRVNAWETAHAG